MANASQTIQTNGLGTITYPVETAGNYFVESKSSIPTTSTGAPANSSLITVIKHNATTLVTSTAGASGAYANEIVCAVGDTLSVVYTSANSIDTALNAVKSTIVFASNQ